MTYDDNKEWIHGSVLEWARSGVSVIARDSATGQLGGTLLATIITREQAQTGTYEHALSSPKTKVYMAVLPLCFTTEIFITYFSSN